MESQNIYHEVLVTLYLLCEFTFVLASFLSKTCVS